MLYFYTYKLPFNPSKEFDYWQGETSGDVLNQALSKYKTTEFHIEEISKRAYCQAKGIPVSSNREMKISLRDLNGSFILRLTDTKGWFVEMNIKTKSRGIAEDVAEELKAVIENNTVESVKLVI